MNIPKLDKRTKADIENRIRNLAEVYTPEWQFAPEHPDLGTAAAEIYAGMMMDVMEKYNRTPEKNMVEFFSKLGVQPIYPHPAQGYVVFSISGEEDNVEGETVETDTTLTAVNNAGEMNVYSLSEELYVLNSRLRDVFLQDTGNDRIYCLFSDEGTELPKNIPTHPEEGRNLQKHEIFFCCSVCEHVENTTEAVFMVQLDAQESGELNHFQKEIERNGISYSTRDGFVKCSRIKAEQDKIYLTFQPDVPPEKITFRGIESYWFSISFADISAIEKNYIKDMRLGTFIRRFPIRTVCSEMGEVYPGHFQPFDRNPIPYTSVYFVEDSVLCRRGAEIHLEFRVDYETSPAREEDNEEEIDWKYIMKKSKFKKPREYDISIRNVVWEYFNGSGWVRLFPDNRFQDIFDGHNDGHLVKIDFTCPDNIETVFLPSGECYAVRARITAVENYMKLAGNYIVPVVSSPVFSYEYQKLPQVEYLITENTMEEQIYRMDKNVHSVRAARREPVIGTSLYFGFSAPPKNPHVHLLFLLDKSEYYENSGYVWEYYGVRGWETLSCMDDTEGLIRTGILILNRPHDFQKTVKFQKENYWIRLRYIEREKFPSRKIRQIYLNAAKIRNLEYREEEYFSVSLEEGCECRLGFGNVYSASVMVNEIRDVSGVTATSMIQQNKAVPAYGENGELTELWVRWHEWNPEDSTSPEGRCFVLDKERSAVIFGMGNGKIPTEAPGENVKITYVTCGGESGNLDAGKTFTMSKRGGFISEITNPGNIYGGSNKEIIGKTLKRASGALKMQHRICTESDYEFAAKYFDPDVMKVKCIGNKNASGEKEYGAVTLVILLENMEHFPKVSEALKSYIQKKNCGNVSSGKFQIIEPEMVYYSIAAIVGIDRREQYSEIQKEVSKKLYGYFDLLNGGEKNNGWEIGELPEKLILYNLFANTGGIAEITHFYLTVSDRNGNELTEGELEDKKEIGMVIPKLKEIQITID